MVRSECNFNTRRCELRFILYYNLIPIGPKHFEIFAAHFLSMNFYIIIFLFFNFNISINRFWCINDTVFRSWKSEIIGQTSSLRSIHEFLHAQQATNYGQQFNFELSTIIKFVHLTYIRRNWTKSWCLPVRNMQLRSYKKTKDRHMSMPNKVNQIWKKVRSLVIIYLFICLAIFPRKFSNHCLRSV